MSDDSVDLKKIKLKKSKEILELKDLIARQRWQLARINSEKGFDKLIWKKHPSYNCYYGHKTLSDTNCLCCGKSVKIDFVVPLDYHKEWLVKCIPKCKCYFKSSKFKSNKMTKEEIKLKSKYAQDKRERKEEREKYRKIRKKERSKHSSKKEKEEFIDDDLD